MFSDERKKTQNAHTHTQTYVYIYKKKEKDLPVNLKTTKHPMIHIYTHQKKL